MAYCVDPAEDVEQQLVAPLLNEPNSASSNNEIWARRPWEDLWPHLLNSIYARLPTHIDGTEFGSVCKNWRQVHCTAALSTTPLPLTVEKPWSTSTSSSSSNSKDNVIGFGAQSVVTKTRITTTESRMRTGRIPGSGDGSDLAFSRMTIVGTAGAWWLLVQEELKSGRGKIDCCFNPLLRSPANLIALPQLSTCSQLATHYDASKVKAAFSALPTACHWAIMVVYPPRRFSTLRSGQRFWRCYEFGGKGESDCIGIGYRDGKFFCLFENGELLIFSVEEGGGERRMLIPGSRPPRLLANLHRVDNYLCVAGSESGLLRVSWGRIDQSKGIFFRLLTVEKVTAAQFGNDEAVARLEEGQRAAVVYQNAPTPIIRRDFVTYIVPLVLLIGLLSGFVVLAIMV